MKNYYSTKQQNVCLSFMKNNVMTPNDNVCILLYRSMWVFEELLRYSAKLHNVCLSFMAPNDIMHVYRI